MKTLTELLDASTSRIVTAGDVQPVLYDSEGQQGSRHVKAVGHALQHVSVLHHKPGSDPHVLKMAYHKRGPMRWNHAQKIVQEMKGPKSHSQFQDDNQAAELIARALNSVGGRVALFRLKDDSNTVKLTYGLTAGESTLERAAHTLSDPTGPDFCNNFVLINDKVTATVVLELHHSCRISNHLHVQSAYPTAEKVGVGKSIVDVTTYPAKTKKKSEYDG